MRKTERLKIAKQICDNYASGEYTLKSCIENAGQGERTFFEWIEKGEKGEAEGGYLKILEMYKEAKDTKREANKRELKDLTAKALVKLLKGGPYEEKHFEMGENGKKIKKSGKIIQKTREPNASVTIFCSKSLLGIKEDSGEDENEENLSKIAEAMREQVKCQKE